MNKFVLIHGTGSSLDNSFGLNIKQRLTKHGYAVVEPIFPVKEKITLAAWIKVMDEFDIGDNSNFLCHSLGATFIIKYLFYKKLRANLVVSIAGGFYTKNQDGPWGEYPQLKKFEPTQEELEYFQRNVKNLYLLHSDNDPIFNQSNFDEYIQKTGAVEMLLPGRGHFGPKSGVKDIPEIETILDSIERN